MLYKHLSLAVLDGQLRDRPFKPEACRMVCFRWTSWLASLPYFLLMTMVTTSFICFSGFLDCCLSGRLEKRKFARCFSIGMMRLPGICAVPLPFLLSIIHTTLLRFARPPDIKSSKLGPSSFPAPNTDSRDNGSVSRWHSDISCSDRPDISIERCMDTCPVVTHAFANKVWGIFSQFVRHQMIPNTIRRGREKTKDCLCMYCVAFWCSPMCKKCFSMKMAQRFCQKSTGTPRAQCELQAVTVQYCIMSSSQNGMVQACNVLWKVDGATPNKYCRLYSNSRKHIHCTLRWAICYGTWEKGTRAGASLNNNTIMFHWDKGSNSNNDAITDETTAQTQTRVEMFQKKYDSLHSQDTLFKICLLAGLTSASKFKPWPTLKVWLKRFRERSRIPGQ